MNNIFFVVWKKVQIYTWIAFVLPQKMLGSQRLTRALEKNGSPILGLGNVFSLSTMCLINTVPKGYL